MPSRNVLALDDMVNFLAEQDKFWDRVINDPRMWREKKATHDASRERHRDKRRQLSFYIDRLKDTEHHSRDPSIADLYDDDNFEG